MNIIGKRKAVFNFIRIHFGENLKHFDFSFKSNAADEFIGTIEKKNLDIIIKHVKYDFYVSTIDNKLTVEVLAIYTNCRDNVYESSVIKEIK